MKNTLFHNFSDTSKYLIMFCYIFLLVISVARGGLAQTCSSLPDGYIAYVNYTQDCQNLQPIIARIMIKNADTAGIPLPMNTPITIYDVDPTTNAALKFHSIATTEAIDPGDSLLLETDYCSKPRAICFILFCIER